MNRRIGSGDADFTSGVAGAEPDVRCDMSPVNIAGIDLAILRAMYEFEYDPPLPHDRISPVPLFLIEAYHLPLRKVLPPAAFEPESGRIGAHGPSPNVHPRLELLRGLGHVRSGQADRLVCPNDWRTKDGRFITVETRTESGPPPCRVFDLHAGYVEHRERLHELLGLEKAHPEAMLGIMAAALKRFRFRTIYQYPESADYSAADVKYFRLYALETSGIALATTTHPGKEVNQVIGTRSRPRSKTELAKRLLGRENARPRDASGLFKRHDLRPFDGKKYTIRLEGLDPQTLARVERD